MAKTASLNIRIDPATKKGAEELYSAFGITVTDAVNMFLRQSLMVGGLPFDLRRPRYNAETEAAMRECEAMLASGTCGTYSSYAEMEADICAEIEAEDSGEI
jgi:DNA-damage-inducible protein J